MANGSEREDALDRWCDHVLAEDGLLEGVEVSRGRPKRARKGLTATFDPRVVAAEREHAKLEHRRYVAARKKRRR